MTHRFAHPSCKFRTFGATVVALPVWLAAAGCPAPVDTGLSGLSTTTDADTGTTGAASSEGDDGLDGTTSALLDIGDGQATQTSGDQGVTGCKGVDFLFVIDNSGSMNPHQQALIDSYPEFIDTIETRLQKLGANSFHVMVTDTDERSVLPPDPQCEKQCFMQGLMGSCSITGESCEYYNPMCVPECMDDPTGTCGIVDCVALTGCDDACECELGSGVTESEQGDACGLTGTGRFMDDTQPAPHETFSCMAAVGTSGAGAERQMGALITALSDTNNDEGGCNEGFLRDDAILVITLVTDEDDESTGLDPDVLVTAVKDTKPDDDAGIVVLGLISDFGLPDATCIAKNGDDGAEPAPNLHQFVDGFERHQTGSICADNYADFFAQAVELIDIACEEYEPVP